MAPSASSLSLAALSGAAAVLIGVGLVLTAQRRHDVSARGPTAGSAASGASVLPLRVPASQLVPTEFDAQGGELRLLRKAEGVLGRRTGALVVVLERLQDGHNYCAVLRTMEAIGVQHVWVVNPPGLESNSSIKRKAAVEAVQTATTTRVRKRAQERVDGVWEADAKDDEKHATYAKRAFQWLTVREFDCTADCVAALRAAGRAIWVTALEQRAEVLAPGAAWLEESGALPSSLALVLGAEEAGVSDEFKAAADRLVYLPLCGFAESLNVSVATALMVQLLLQLLADRYSEEELALSPEESQSLRADWYTKLARTEEDRQQFTELLDNPPKALDDMRRPEEHRVHRTGRRHNKDNKAS